MKRAIIHRHTRIKGLLCRRKIKRKGSGISADRRIVGGILKFDPSKMPIIQAQLK